jgi:hypothetical protein
MSAPSFAEDSGCPEFPETVDCLKNQPWRCQGRTGLCYGFSGADLMTCALRIDGVIDQNTTVDAHEFSVEYKYWLAKNYPEKAIADAPALSRNDPLAGGRIKRALEAATQNANGICVSRSDIEYDYKNSDIRQYERDLKTISDQATQGQKCELPIPSDASHETIRFFTQIDQLHRLIDLRACHDRVHLKSELKPDLLEISSHTTEKKAEFTRKLKLALARGWPVPINSQAEETDRNGKKVNLGLHLNLITASSFRADENGKMRCFLKLRDSNNRRPMNSNPEENWVPMDEVFSQLEEAHFYSFDAGKKVSTPPPAKQKPIEKPFDQSQVLSLMPKRPKPTTPSSQKIDTGGTPSWRYTPLKESNDGIACRVNCGATNGGGAFKAVQSQWGCWKKCEEVCGAGECEKSFTN